MSRRSVFGGIRRGLASVLAVMFIGVCMLGSAREAEAAATTKAYYVPTKMTVKYTYSEGDSETYSTSFSYYSGDRAGLLKQVRQPDGYRLVLARNGQGLVTNFKTYPSVSSRPNGQAKMTINKGKVKRLHYYSIYEDGTKRESSTGSFSYRGGRVTKMALNHSGYMKQTYSYRSNGTCSKAKMEQGSSYITTVTYNKKGLPTKLTSSSGTQYKGQITYTYAYDKKGNPKKITSTQTNTSMDESGPQTYKIKVVVTNKFSYDKKGNITKCVRKETMTYPDGSKHTNNTTYTFKYKKVMVKKKYWDMMDGKVPYAPGMYNSVKELVDYGVDPLNNMR